MHFLKPGLHFFFFMGVIVLSDLDAVSAFSQDNKSSADKIEQVLIHLKNIPEGSKLIPGSEGVITLENRSFKEESQTLDGMAGFYNVPAKKGYTVKGMYKSAGKAFDNPTELWGIWKDIDITPRRTEFSVVRNMPYIVDVNMSYQRENTANPSLARGDEVTFNVFYRNPSDESYKSQLVLLLQNSRSGEVIRLEKDVVIQPSERYGHEQFEFTAPEAGEYYFAVGVFVKQRINQWTDSWDWSETPLFFVTSEHRTIEFSGYTWDVKAGYGNPGGNFWTNDSSFVWIDGRGRLNLTLSPAPNGNWYASEVISQKTFGHGIYTFYLDADVQTFDPHVVAGIFLYKDEENEIDIEFSRWGDSENYQLGNYVIQPSEQPGNHFRFPILTSGSYTTHRIVWTPDEILFSSWHGHYEEAPEGRIIAQWQYAGTPIQHQEQLRLFFNLWLFRGIKPKSDKPEIFTIARFTYEPLPEESGETEQ